MATRRAPPPPPQSPHVTAEQARRGAARLERLVKELEAFDVNVVSKRWSTEQRALEARIEGDLAAVFGHGTPEYNRYSDSTSLDNGPVVVMRSGQVQDIGETRRNLNDGIARAASLLRTAIQWLQDEAADREIPLSHAPSPGPEAESPASFNRKIFIVHGRDEGSRETVARFIERIKFGAVILHEQANRGDTVIQKIERHSDVGFAIVLLTPDDVGGLAGQGQRSRPRQNVLLELGYFFGKLGRDRVCALIGDSSMDLPSDFGGIVWVPLDSNGGWKIAVAKELEAAGFEVDWNLAMR